MKTLANAGSAGGSMYYVNLGGLKILWGTTNVLSVNSTVITAAVTLPSGFFSSLQATLAQANQVSGDNRETVDVYQQSTSSLTLCYWNTGGVNSGSAAASYFVVGT